MFISISLSDGLVIRALSLWFLPSSFLSLPLLGLLSAYAICWCHWQGYLCCWAILWAGGWGWSTELLDLNLFIPPGGRQVDTGSADVIPAGGPGHQPYSDCTTAAGVLDCLPVPLSEWALGLPTNSLLGFSFSCSLSRESKAFFVFFL